MIVNRGPQFVQLMNGYPNRRSPGSASSARQSAQVALSAETRARRRPVGSLGAIENPAAPFGVMGCAVTRSTRASGGASRSIRTRNFRTDSAAPSTSAKTPSTSLPPHPARPSRDAREHTNGRNPSPLTTPSTRTDVRMRWVTRPVCPLRGAQATGRSEVLSSPCPLVTHPFDSDHVGRVEYVPPPVMPCLDQAVRAQLYAGEGELVGGEGLYGAGASPEDEEPPRLADQRGE